MRGIICGPGDVRSEPFLGCTNAVQGWLNVKSKLRHTEIRPNFGDQFLARFREEYRVEGFPASQGLEVRHHAVWHEPQFGLASHARYRIKVSCQCPSAVEQLSPTGTHARMSQLFVRR